MASVCDVCGKGPGFGHNVSHSHRRTNRRWNPNIQTVRTPAGVTRERVPGPSTYACQLRAFRAAVLDGGPVLTGAADAVPTMALIDDAYRAAGLQPRRPTPVAGRPAAG